MNERRRRTVHVAEEGPTQGIWQLRPTSRACRGALRGRGIAVGCENGLRGADFEQGIRLRIPFHTNWGVLGKGLYLHDFGRSQNGVRAGSLLEVRGGSGVHGSGAGATAIAGLQLYPGS